MPLDSRYSADSDRSQPNLSLEVPPACPETTQ